MNEDDIYKFLEMSNIAIHYKRNKEEVDQVLKVSELIANLHLPTKDNDRLIHELTKLLNITKKDLYLQGFKIALEIMAIDERETALTN